MSLFSVLNEFAETFETFFIFFSVSEQRSVSGGRARSPTSGTASEDDDLFEDARDDNEIVSYIPVPPTHRRTSSGKYLFVWFHGKIYFQKNLIIMIYYSVKLKIVYH